MPWSTGHEPARHPKAVNASILTLGANWFLNSKVKFTTDWGINFAQDLNLFDDPSDGWRESGTNDEWVLRAQFQLLF